MKKNTFLLLLVLVLIADCVFAAKYSEDNAAYWYQKAFNDLKNINEANDFSRSEEARKISSIKSLEDYNKLTPETKKIFEESLKNFIADIKKAKDQKKCIFWEMPLNDKDENNTQFQDTKMFFKGFRMANALAWHAVSVNKPNIAGVIWQTMLNLSILVSENNLIPIRIIAGGTTVNLVIPNLDNYFANGASDEFKSKFVNYLKKWPKSIFNISDAIKVFYEYQKTNINLYADNQKFLATLFGAKIGALTNEEKPKPIIIENPQCKSKLRVIEGAIEMFQMDESDGSNGPDLSFIEDKRKRADLSYKWKEAKRLKTQIDNNVFDQDEYGFLDNDDFEPESSPDKQKEKVIAKFKSLESYLKENGVTLDDEKASNDFSKMTWDEIITKLKNKNYLRGEDKYLCPQNGTRTVKAIKSGEEISYEITCDCGKAKDPMDDFKADSEPMKMAKAYRDTKFDSDKKQLFEYYEMLLKADHSKSMTDKEMLALNSAEIPEYKNNALLMWMGLGYNSFRKSFEDYQKTLDDFIKKYDKQ